MRLAPFITDDGRPSFDTAGYQLFLDRERRVVAGRYPGLMPIVKNGQEHVENGMQWFRNQEGQQVQMPVLIEPTQTADVMPGLARLRPRASPMPTTATANDNDTAMQGGSTPPSSRPDDGDGELTPTKKRPAGPRMPTRAQKNTGLPGGSFLPTGTGSALPAPLMGLNSNNGGQSLSAGGRVGHQDPMSVNGHGEPGGSDPDALDPQASLARAVKNSRIPNQPTTVADGPRNSEVNLLNFNDEERPVAAVIKAGEMWETVNTDDLVTPTWDSRLYPEPRAEPLDPPEAVIRFSIRPPPRNVRTCLRAFVTAIEARIRTMVLNEGDKEAQIFRISDENGGMMIDIPVCAPVPGNGPFRIDVHCRTRLQAHIIKEQDTFTIDDDDGGARPFQRTAKVFASGSIHSRKFVTVEMSPVVNAQRRLIDVRWDDFWAASLQVIQMAQTIGFRLRGVWRHVIVGITGRSTFQNVVRIIFERTDECRDYNLNKWPGFISSKGVATDTPTMNTWFFELQYAYRSNRHCAICKNDKHSAAQCSQATCFLCTKVGHVQDDCPLKDGSRSQSGQGKRPHDGNSRGGQRTLLQVKRQRRR